MPWMSDHKGGDAYCCEPWRSYGWLQQPYIGGADSLCSWPHHNYWWRLFSLLVTPPQLLMKTVSVVEVNDEDEASVGAAAPATSATSFSMCVLPYAWSSCFDNAVQSEEAGKNKAARMHIATALAQHFALSAIGGLQAAQQWKHRFR